MSNERRPLTDHVTKAGPPDFSRLGWVVAVLCIALAVVFLVLWYNALNRQHELESLPAKLDDATSSLNAALADDQKDKDQIAALQKQVDDLQSAKAAADQVAQSAQSLQDEMRANLESKDVTISNLQGKLTVNILDRVMFDSGEAVLKPGGQDVLRKVAALLAAHPNLKINVIGHTDNVPIRSRFASNWELSTARALAAVHFLTEQAGLDPRRVGAVGYGEYRPIADNSTAEGRARNRRIAIAILSDELSTADTPPAAPAPAPPTPPADLPPPPAPPAN